jgi:hypothetical protein
MSNLHNLKPLSNESLRFAAEAARKKSSDIHCTLVDQQELLLLYDTQ